MKLKNLLNNLEGQIDMSKVDTRVKMTKNDKKKHKATDQLGPIIYQGTKLHTYKDLEPLVKLDSFETVVLEKLRTLKAIDQTQIPENERDPLVKIDDHFLDLVDKARPYGMYFQ